jgi:hypothetical protein
MGETAPLDWAALALVRMESTVRLVGDMVILVPPERSGLLRPINGWLPPELAAQHKNMPKLLLGCALGELKGVKRDSITLIKVKFQQVEQAQACHDFVLKKTKN